MAAPTLYIFAGLPASGKTTLAQLLAVELKAVHLRIDTIEQALRKRQVPGSSTLRLFVVMPQNIVVELKAD